VFSISIRSDILFPLVIPVIVFRYPDFHLSMRWRNVAFFTDQP
jgi:hypothetical protein